MLACSPAMAHPNFNPSLHEPSNPHPNWTGAHPNWIQPTQFKSWKDTNEGIAIHFGIGSKSLTNYLWNLCIGHQSFLCICKKFGQDKVPTNNPCVCCFHIYFLAVGHLFSAFLPVVTWLRTQKLNTSKIGELTLQSFPCYMELAVTNNPLSFQESKSDSLLLLWCPTCLRN